MVISGTIGRFVVQSEQPIIDLLFWRCVFGAATTSLIVCAVMGMLRGMLTLRLLALAALGGAAIVLNWVLIFASFSRASISIATAVYNTQPFMLAHARCALLLRTADRNEADVARHRLHRRAVRSPRPSPTTALTPGTDYVAGILMALGARLALCRHGHHHQEAQRHPAAPDRPHPALRRHSHARAFCQLLEHALRCAELVGTLVAIDVRVHRGLGVRPALRSDPEAAEAHLTGALSFIYPVVAIGVDFLAFGHRLHPVQIVGAAAILIAAAGMTLGRSLPGAKAPSAGVRPPCRLSSAGARFACRTGANCRRRSPGRSPGRAARRRGRASPR